MKAFVRTETGISLDDVPIPVPGPTQILVKVHASSLNRADLALADGKAHGQHGGAGTPLGLEWAGEVVALGSTVTAYGKADRVMCSGLGGFAEYAVTDWRRAFPLPDSAVDYDTAACLPIALRTSHTALAELGQLRAGQSVLILGASSSVGLMCLQVAKLLGAGLLIGTSTKPDSRARLSAFGVDLALDSGDPEWAAQALAATQGRGADLLVDFLAGPLINDSMRATAIGGRMVNVGRMAGETGRFDFDLHSLRRIQYLGMTFRTRTDENIGEIAQRVRADLWPALQSGKLGLPIDVRLPLEQAEDAFALMRRNEHFGKIVLTQ
ncbi:zinc-binding dehydrogenase [Verticiella sediminum]|uniref:Zinc-binding dehydrogenase n=1 Tax=Verticiella sediminum TaxID=1247510 RepID=A0A556AXJ9_9BURK|nr:zinc-binding dehydrogenase [Verticiella sediminum]TSH97671.1 zinc-binding dehydrogenase [Verticiella sediminum]